ncbi:hypothetical protein EMWEY_00004270 [Eimeria maxima]|uniref:Uncharacterized protein n=1 Tax=Eimeria maxima TaxID=5804 RepID=U6M630_EIMMA|nr:hypothetical protein EMWEY_00004270 [Eimeria maxima]CDJ59491.1 hypothetical protein EMWEY_00004270 [Eimeria maxima]
MSTSETTIQGGASKHSSPHDGLVCKPLRFVRPSEASENVGKSAVVETQVSGKAAAKSECCVAGETTGGTRVPEQPSCLVIQTPSSCNENSGCEGEQGGTVSSEGSSRSSITGCPSQAGSEPYPLRPSVEGQDDRQDVAWTTVVTEAPKETGQAGVINSGSDGATNPHQQPCSWAYGESVGGLGGVQIGQMSCPSNPFESQESRRVAEEDESILEVASAPQTIAIQRSTSLMDAPPSCILQDDSVSQVEQLRSITSQESSTAPANCTPTARSSADEEGSAIDSTGCSNKSSTVPANLGEGALAEMHGDLSARILPPLPNRNGENSEVEAVDIQPKPVAADAVQGTVEEQALGQTWNRATSTEGATACTPLQDASERDAFSETIDTGMCRTEAPAGQGSCATVSQDELNFLARKLTDLLRTAAEEIRLLNIGSLADLTRSDEHGQNRNPAVGEPALTTSGGVDSYSVPVSGNDQDAESLPSSRASSADTERQAVPAALPGSQTPHHPPD